MKKYENFIGANPMFQGKKKNRVEQARKDLQKQLRLVNKQAKDTRKSFVKRLNHTADDLRSDIQDLFKGEEKHQANRVAQDLEKLAHTIEAQAEQSFDDVNESASEKVWVSVLFALIIGIILGVVFKQLVD
jgi:ElaB/YqjD/DUF883 family membrane-anchored ribosome-binding protein